ncbi:JmjC domain, hydroxylase-domain-containing protein [Scheffersomyces coipomensis]|uniref:JmjC domain, hydroxylase-domain-containing protein n=1 Tax=Scheffersomyces coipomensis TaxID=1788519 RepID=UPI00315D7F6E
MESEYGYDPQLVIEPAYYSGGVPVFEPTMKQFEDFYKFNKAINRYGMESGIVKVVPPREWQNAVKKGYNVNNLSRIHIKNPILQQINHIGSGVFSQQNIERPRKYDIFQWKELAEKANNKPPSIRKKSEDAPSNSDKNEKSKPSQSPPRRHHHHYNSTYNIDTSEFTEERCEELEKNYWRTLTYAEPMYGADMLGSIFEDSIKSWNVNSLPNILDLMDVKLPGVNDAYLYAGLWKATFAWHLEDQDLYSINYLHFGAPKQWYSIPQSERERFFDIMQDTFHDEYKNCPEFLRHKTFLVSPAFLAKHGITVNKIVHNEGEFMITYPYGYHAGFNYGYNLAESVNFALDDWFPIGKASQKCECISDAVAINIEQIVCKFKGIPYVPPDSDSDTEQTEDQKGASKQQPIIKRVKKTPKQSNSQSSLKTERECYLCPNNFSNNPMMKADPLFHLIDTDLTIKGNKAQVHKICANMFKNELTYDPENESIAGLSLISKDQKKLPCKLCLRTFEGACFQCSYSKCTRAYHGTCGVADGVVYNLEDGGKVLCKYHRSKKMSNNRFQKLSSIQGISSFIQFVFNGRYYFGKVLRNNQNEHSFHVLVYPDLHEVFEISYDNVLIGSNAEQLDNSIFIDTFKSNYLNIKADNIHSSNDNIIEISDEESQEKYNQMSNLSSAITEHKNYISIPSSPQSELASSPRIFTKQAVKKDAFKDEVIIISDGTTQAENIASDELDTHTAGEVVSPKTRSGRVYTK